MSYRRLIVITTMVLLPVLLFLLLNIKYITNPEKYFFLYHELSDLASSPVYEKKIEGGAAVGVVYPYVPFEYLGRDKDSIGREWHRIRLDNDATGYLLLTRSPRTIIIPYTFKDIFACNFIRAVNWILLKSA